MGDTDQTGQIIHTRVSVAERKSLALNSLRQMITFAKHLLAKMTKTNMTTLTFHRDELARLIELCDKFDTNTITVKHEDGSGIGYLLHAIIKTQVNGVNGSLTVAVTDESDW